jgi:hypothetical protein
MKIKHDNNTAIVTCLTKRNQQDGTGTECEFTFDMESWSDIELRELALKTLTIKAQAQFRKGNIEAVASLDKSDFNERKRKDPGVALKDYIQQQREAGRTWAEIASELGIEYGDDEEANDE